jgi:deazaflavin-dependent oxidoreductase (nitroreductase family)
MSVTSSSSPPSRLARGSRAAARITAPLSRPFAGRRLFPLWAVLHHQGRRTGRDYAVPVAVRVSPDSFVIALPWGAETQWLRNVIAAGGCTIRWRGADHRTTEPQVIGIGDASEAFTLIQRWFLGAAGVSTFLRLRRM